MDERASDHAAFDADFIESARSDHSAWNPPGARVGRAGVPGVATAFASRDNMTNGAAAHRASTQEPGSPESGADPRAAGRPRIPAPRSGEPSSWHHPDDSPAPRPADAPVVEPLPRRSARTAAEAPWADFANDPNGSGGSAWKAFGTGPQQPVEDQAPYRVRATARVQMPPDVSGPPNAVVLPTVVSPAVTPLAVTPPAVTPPTATQPAATVPPIAVRPPDPVTPSGAHSGSIAAPPDRKGSRGSHRAVSDDTSGWVMPPGAPSAFDTPSAVEGAAASQRQAAFEHANADTPMPVSRHSASPPTETVRAAVRVADVTPARPSNDHPVADVPSSRPAVDPAIEAPARPPVEPDAPRTVPPPAYSSSYSNEDWRSNVRGSSVVSVESAGTVYRADTGEEEDEPISLAQLLLRIGVIVALLIIVVLIFLYSPAISQWLG